MKVQKIEKYGQKTPNFGKISPIYLYREYVRQLTFKSQLLFHSARYLHSVKSCSYYLALISNNFETLKNVIVSNFTKNVSSCQSWSKIKTKF